MFLIEYKRGVFIFKTISDWLQKYLEAYDFRGSKEIDTNPYKNSFSIKQIFLDNWDDFCRQPDVIKNGIRSCVAKEVEKMMKCYDFNYGFALFECPACNNFTRVPFTCKSRFCNKCGIIYARQRANAVSKKTLDVSHRHVVFTIDKDLRYFFKKDRSLLGCLFKAVENTVFFALEKCGRKTEHLVPGFIMVLHTFGRDLKWNPHIHVLLTEGGMTEQGVYKKVNYIHYRQLRKSFQKELFDQLSDHTDVFGGKDRFYAIKNRSYGRHDEGFYVYAPPQKNNRSSAEGRKQVVSYILRYTGRPVMAQSRIEAYDKESRIIQYWYEPHEGGDVVHVTENVLVFIGKLVQHIMPAHFKSIRYAGIYAAKDHKYREKKKQFAKKQSRDGFIHRFRSTIIQDFKRDPLLCSCGTVMEFVEIFILDQTQKKGRDGYGNQRLQPI